MPRVQNMQNKHETWEAHLGRGAEQIQSRTFSSQPFSPWKHKYTELA